MHPQFLKLLVCPVAKCPLQYDARAQELISLVAGLAYPIRDGIPILIPDEARVLEVQPTPEATQDSFVK